MVEGETAIYKIKGAIKQHSMKKLASCFLITQIALSAFAQSNQQAFFGFGIGLDYGGIGIKAELQPLHESVSSEASGSTLIDRLLMQAYRTLF